jgi:hypothetical protein
MNSTLDDFFGNSGTAKKECLYCGGADGDLVVAVRDASGPTHWHHKDCHSNALAKQQAEEEARLARYEALARDEEDGIFD